MFDDEENFDPMKRYNRIRQMPIFLKAEEIAELVRHLVKSVENTDIKFKRKGEKEMLEHNLNYLMENSMIITAKIAGAEGVEIYDLKMENAAIIRKAARELITDARGIQMHGFKDTEYLDLLRKEVEEFRILFAEWVKTFDPWDYIIDRWGLFNPPGVNYDDHDPEDDIPFYPNDLPDKFFGDLDDDDFEEDWEDFMEDDDSEE
ncbi:hypothetical protein Aeqsu_0391 [Aequorivita sublithincola DSM 14238]|uniref:Uncharacterized protein n=1 Tax=Aequorivita sublithincola (strain DSM 14238 / LMG 21431 / ACAM 643 / 9-3) TaxID=746697 RepID=I3YSD6_AEQSU|nr:hypothetical protein [Aequorivita sublithincola]AFL79904.1 hypothetical protein Aeqsu_0391 [Aequorivita sublithincola DSM 14238]